MFILLQRKQISEYCSGKVALWLVNPLPELNSFSLSWAELASGSAPLLLSADAMRVLYLNLVVQRRLACSVVVVRRDSRATNPNLTLLIRVRKGVG